VFSKVELSNKRENVVKKRFLKYVAILLVMLGGCNADYHTKKWAHCTMKHGQSITVIKNFIDLGYTENRGMIFGILNGHMPQFPKTIAIIFRVFIIFGLMGFIWINRKKHFIFLLPFLLFWAGAIGNLIDPFLYGYVVDFIHIRAGTILNWPFYFNLADAYLTIGMILFLFGSVYSIIKT
jgi:signal peptidase II